MLALNCKSLLWLLVSATVLNAADNSVPSGFAVEVTIGGKMLAVRNVPSDPDSTITLMWSASTLEPKLSRPVNTLGAIVRPGSASAVDAFELSFQTEGDSVRAQPAIYLAGSVKRPPGNKVPERMRAVRRQIGDRLLRLDDRWEIAEMAQSDLIPLVVRVTPARKSSLGLFTVSSRVSSVQLKIREQIEYVGTRRYSFRSWVRNNSPWSLLIGEVRLGCDNREGAFPLIGEITPGIIAEPFGLVAGDCEMRTQSELIRSRKAQLSLVGVIFDDGRYEGDIRNIAPEAGHPLAGMLLIRRFREAADPILADTGAADAAKLARLRALADSLPDLPDKAMLDEVYRRMRGLPNSHPRISTTVAANAGVYQQKRLIRDALSEYQVGVSPPLSEWLRLRLRTMGIASEMQKRVDGQ